MSVAENAGVQMLTTGSWQIDRSIPLSSSESGT
jgi:hypothetical protein